MIFVCTSTFSQVEGTWQMAPEAGSLGVGPNQGDISWWAIDEAGVIERDCFFDDKFVFNEDGSFNNVMEAETWIEGWQGISPDQCGTPVYPHDGSNPATWTYDEVGGTLELFGTGAHLGIPKAANGFELTDPSQAPESISYLVTSINATSMTLDISFGTGWWRFILAKEAASGEDASLSDLQVDGTTIDGFSPFVENYIYGLPEGTVDVPQITSATPTDPDVTGLVITQATAIPGDATVVVTSANGNVTKTYTVSYAIINPLTLPVTFDDDISYGLTDFGGNSSEIIVDPTNAENKVAKSTKTLEAETWAGTTVGGDVGFTSPIPFAEGETTMTVAIWSPTAGTPMRLKVEAASDPTISVETETLTTVAEAWEVIIFDFSNEAPGTEPLSFDKSYNKASIFFNFGTTGAVAGEQTYYWDDMEFTGGGGEPKPLLALDVQDNFEDDGYATITDWKFQDPDLEELPVIVDPTNAENHVAEYNRSGNFEWTNAQFVLDHRMDLTERNKFEIKAYFPSSNDYTGDLAPTLALKLQNSLLGGEAWTTQTEVILTVDEFDTWLTLEFDFAEVADREDYDQVVVQFGGEGHFAPGQFYFDDINLMDDTYIWEQAPKTFEISPNPVADEFVIDGVENVSSVKIFNMQGQLVITESGNVSVVSVSQLPVGIYQVVAESGEGDLYTAKMLKKQIFHKLSFC